MLNMRLDAISTTSAIWLALLSPSSASPVVLGVRNIGAGPFEPYAGKINGTDVPWIGARLVTVKSNLYLADFLNASYSCPANPAQCASATPKHPAIRVQNQKVLLVSKPKTMQVVG